jgi:hypothetical protein
MFLECVSCNWPQKLSELFPHVAAILPQRAVGTASVLRNFDIDTPLE